MSNEVTYLIKVGDVMQIDPAHDEVFGGCLLIVTEVKSWGVQGYVDIPAPKDERGLAFYRCKYENCALVGPAMWVRDRDENE